jgi:hypothetical protein
MKRIDPLTSLRILQRARAKQSKTPLAVDQQRDLAIGYHGALEALRTGNATEADAHTLAMASNVCLMLCELGLGSDQTDAVKEAQGYIVAMMDRADLFGSYAFTGPGLKACQVMLELHDAQLESPDCTEGLMLAALAEIRRRIAIGATLEAA